MKKIMQMQSRSDTAHKECGAIIVEATFSLSIFMFVMFVMLQVTQIAYTQARMSVALGASAKQLAQYTHIYYVTGLDKAMGGSGGGKSSELFDKVGGFLSDIGGKVGDIGGGFGGDIGDFISGVGSFTTETGDAISGDSLGQYITHAVGSGVLWSMTKSNLDRPGMSADQFLKRNHIVESSVDFTRSSILEKGDKDIFVCVRYDVQIVKFPLLSLDYRFHLQSWAFTKAWGN